MNAVPKKEPDWQLCEQTKMIEHERNGCLVVPTGKGHDFLTICPSEKPTFIEVKQGCGSLTEFQRKTLNKVKESGYEYKIERCSCSRNREKKGKT